MFTIQPLVQGAALTAFKRLWINIAVCTFIGNRAVDEGSVIFTTGSSFHTANSSFSNNSADYNGGVIFSEKDSFHIADSTFTGPLGGVIYSKASFFHIADSLFSNTYIGGVITSDTSSFNIFNSAFSNNSADNGGVIYSDGSSFHAADSTFKSNSAIFGGAIHSVGGSFYVSDCTFRDNRASTDGGVIVASSRSSLHIADSSFTYNSVGIYNSSTMLERTLGYCCNNIFSLQQSSINISGTTSFVKNVGSQVYAATSNVTFSGFTRFENCGNMNVS